MKRILGVLMAATVVAAMMAPVPASAFAPAPTVPEPTTIPASTIVSVIGDVLPDQAAARTAGFSLSNGANGSINSQALGSTGAGALKVAAEVPGFKLGWKVGEYISAATGLYDGAATLAPDPAFVPYSDLSSADAAGWPDGYFPQQYIYGATHSDVDGGDASGVYLAPDPVLWAYGAQPGWQGGHTHIKLSGHLKPYSQRAGLTAGILLFCHTDAGAVVQGSAFQITMPAVASEGDYSTDNNYDGDGLACPNPGYSFDHFVLQYLYYFGYGNPFSVPWYPAGHPLAPAGPGADRTPDRRWLTTVTCKLTTGTEVTVNGISPKFKENASSFPQYPIAQCPDGSVPIGIRTDLQPGEGGPIIGKVVEHLAPKPWIDFAAAHPNCTTGNCAVTIEKLDGTGLRTSCFADKTGCEQWFDDPAKSSKFQCRQDGQVLPLSDCNHYAHIFDPVAQARAAGYSDPLTGRAPSGGQPAPIDDPGNQTSGGTVPVPVPGSGSCFPSGWSAFNPFEWVYQPATCALRWAFVPDPAAMTAFSVRVRTAYNATAIGEWLTAVAGIGHVFMPEGGCDGLHAHVGLMVTNVDLHLFSTCEQPWKGLGFVVKSFLVLMICWFSGTGVLRSVAAAFGLNITWGRKSGE